MRKTHSNSFVDLDKDGNADIIVTTDFHFELWHDAGKKEENGTTFIHAKNVKLPKECGENLKCSVGQLAFADFDLDGQLDLVLPICDDVKCANSTLYFATVRDLWNAKEDDNQDLFKPMTVDLR